MPDSGAPLLRMEKISKAFGSTVALQQVDFQLQRGEIHALIGENGAGKSTLMKMLSGALNPDGGTMAFEGQPYCPESPNAARQQGIAMIYQELNLAPHLNALDNIMLGIEESRLGFLKRGAMRAKVSRILKRLNHAEIPLDVPVRRLSVSAQQILEIARALILQAKIIIMDEPTSSLSSDDMETLFAVIRDLRGEGISVIYISHFLEEVKRVADRYTVLRDGFRVGSGPTAAASVEELVTLMLGQKLTEMFPRVPWKSGDTILEAVKLSGRRLPRGVSLALRRGEILGVTGLIGAGRSELLKALYGLEPIRSGRVRMQQVSLRKVSPPRMLASGVGYLSENRKEEGLALSRSIADNITLSDFGTCSRLGWIRAGQQRQQARDWMARLDIVAAGPDQKAENLSGGNQQKVALARLLHSDADVLLLDEPTRGIDVKSKAQIYRIVGELAQRGKAVLFVSSYIPELLGVCHRIAVMHRGRLVELRWAREWDEHALMLAASVGKASALMVDA